MMMIYYSADYRVGQHVIWTESSTERRSVWYDVYSRTCFSVSDARLSWRASAEQCQRLQGGRLAVVVTADQLSAVRQMMAAFGHSAVWIGGRREATSWKWSDGTLLGSLSATAIRTVNWAVNDF